MKKFFLFLLFLEFISCSKNEPEEGVIAPTTSGPNIDLVFDKATKSLSAIKGPKTKALNSSIESFYTIDCGDEAAPLYMVNFSNAGGSVLISSDYRDGYTAYLISENSAISEEELADTTSPIALYCKLIQDYRANTIFPATKSKDYTVEETIISNTGVGPLLSTVWKQSEPFNNYLFDAEPEHGGWPMGCGPVAVAQVLRFYNYPSGYAGITFNWDRINLVDSEHELSLYLDEVYEVSKLIYAAGKAVKVDYTTIKEKEEVKRVATSLLDNIKSGLSDMGYNYSFGEFSISNVLLSLNSSLPILTVGVNSQLSSGHVWVIDGYRDTVTATRCYDDDGNLLSNTDLDDNAFNTTSKYLHINYGQGESEYRDYYNAIDRLNGEVYVYWTPKIFRYTEYNKDGISIPTAYDSNIQCFYNLAPNN